MELLSKGSIGINHRRHYVDISRGCRVFFVCVCRLSGRIIGYVMFLSKDTGELKHCRGATAKASFSLPMKDKALEVDLTNLETTTCHGHRILHDLPSR